LNQEENILNASELNIKLWQRFKAGDAEALGQLAQTHYRALYNYATKFSSDPDFIRDSIQELYLELWERRNFLSETAFVKSYLLKALRHKLIKESIRLKRFHEPQVAIFDTDPSDPSIETNIIEAEHIHFQNGHLKRIISLLSKRQQGDHLPPLLSKPRQRRHRQHHGARPPECLQPALPYFERDQGNLGSG
jgi:RNA polymerase sigma factor (sigma-70 family)